MAAMGIPRACLALGCVLSLGSSASPYDDLALLQAVITPHSPDAAADGIYEPLYEPEGLDRVLELAAASQEDRLGLLQVAATSARQYQAGKCTAHDKVVLQKVREIKDKLKKKIKDKIGLLQISKSSGARTSQEPSTAGEIGTDAAFVSASGAGAASGGLGGIMGMGKCMKAMFGSFDRDGMAQCIADSWNITQICASCEADHWHHMISKCAFQCMKGTKSVECVECSRPDLLHECHHGVNISERSVYYSAGAVQASTPKAVAAQSAADIHAANMEKVRLASERLKVAKANATQLASVVAGWEAKVKEQEQGRAEVADLLGQTHDRINLLKEKAARTHQRSLDLAENEQKRLKRGFNRWNFTKLLQQLDEGHVNFSRLKYRVHEPPKVDVMKHVHKVKTLFAGDTVKIDDEINRLQAQEEDCKKQIATFQQAADNFKAELLAARALEAAADEAYELVVKETASARAAIVQSQHEMTKLVETTAEQRKFNASVWLEQHGGIGGALGAFKHKESSAFNMSMCNAYPLLCKEPFSCNNPNTSGMPSGEIAASGHPNFASWCGMPYQAAATQCYARNLTGYAHLLYQAQSEMGATAKMVMDLDAQYCFVSGHCDNMKITNTSSIEEGEALCDEKYGRKEWTSFSMKDLGVATVKSAFLGEMFGSGKDHFKIGKRFADGFAKLACAMGNLHCDVIYCKVKYCSDEAIRAKYAPKL